MKKSIFLMLVIAMLFGIFAMCGITSFAEDDILRYEITDGEVTITDCAESVSGTVLIPDTIEGCPVTEIGERAFYRCENLENITIPDSVTTIGNEAFAYCWKLTEIILPESLKTIGYYAFLCCELVTDITIPANVTDIGLEAFGYCNALEFITVDEKNTAFSNDEYGILFNADKTELIWCPTGKKLTTYSIPDSVTKIARSAFIYNESLTEVIMGDNVTIIDNDAFAVCRNLKTVKFSENLTTIGEFSFYCSGLEYISLSENLKTIDIGAFAVCVNLKEVVLPESVEAINEAAFIDCINLESVTILNPECNIFFDVYEDEHTISDTATIYGYEGSTAQRYAEEFNREFVAISPACAHTNISIMDAIAVGCEDDGYTGNLYCNDCEEFVEYGEVISSTGHADADNNNICDNCETTINAVQPEPEDTEEEPQSFFGKIIAFFNNIIEMIKKLFGIA